MPPLGVPAKACRRAACLYWKQRQQKLMGSPSLRLTHGLSR